MAKETLDRFSDLVHRYSIAIAETGDFADFPLKDIGITSYSMEQRDKFHTEAADLAQKPPLPLSAHKLSHRLIATAVTLTRQQ